MFALITSTCCFAVKKRMHFSAESGSSSLESKRTIYSNQAELEQDDLFSASEMLEKLKNLGISDKNNEESNEKNNKYLKLISPYLT